MVRCARETMWDELRRWCWIDVDLAEGNAWFQVGEGCSESARVSSAMVLFNREQRTTHMSL